MKTGAPNASLQH